ncbi:hypothetical protein ACLB2K_050146 [Fragaria x ananassa]
MGIRSVCLRSIQGMSGWRRCRRSQSRSSRERERRRVSQSRSSRERERGGGYLSPSQAEREADSTPQESFCSICCLVRNRDLREIDIIPGGSMKIVRESPTSAVVRFKAGSVEPAHHHTFGHDLVVIEGGRGYLNPGRAK